MTHQREPLRQGFEMVEDLVGTGVPQGRPGAHTEHVTAGPLCCLDPGGSVLDHDAVAWLNLQQLAAKQIGLRVRLASRHVLSGHHDRWDR